MTLRTRLTAAFLAVVLGPVLLGAAFVNYAVSAAARERSVHQLDLAAAATRSAVTVLCQQLRAAAEVLAAQPPEQWPVTAQTLLDQELVAAVQVNVPHTEPWLAPSDAPPQPWAGCAEPPATGQDVHPAAIAAQVPLSWRGGEVWAAARLDQRLVEQLSQAAGASVTLLDGGRAAPLHSNDPAVADTVAAAAELAEGQAGESADGRWVRRLEPAEGQPLPLVLAVAPAQPEGLRALLTGLVTVTGLLAVLLAWRLGSATTRPLTELAQAANRVAEGDLGVRVPVRGNDEAGRLAATFNRMAHRTQMYVQALTASRDQLRRHLTVLGQTLSSTHDLNRILRVILQTAQTATAARAGAVLLLDPDQQRLVGHATDLAGSSGPPGTASGLPALAAAPPAAAAPVEIPEPRERASTRDEPGDGAAGVPQSGDGAGAGAGSEPGGEDAGGSDPDGAGAGAGGRDGAAPLTVPVGPGLLGAVAGTGQARRGRVSRDGPALHESEPDCRTYLVVPISGPAAGELPPVRGVLAVYDQLGGEEFDDTDLIMLQTFAGQAAVAVNNVRSHQEAQRLSMTDPLTGLWNYRSMQESIHREVERATRFNHPLAVLMLDLDRFKEVNDAYGHPAGDAVLAEFAQRVKCRIREVDLAFRHGGEEFVVMLPETDGRGARVLAERLGAAVRERPVMITLRGTDTELPIQVTVSIGIAVYPDHAATPESLLDAADDALYAAKAAGRDTYRMAPPRRDGDGGPAPGDDGTGPVRSERAGGGSAMGRRDPDRPGGAHPPRQTRGR